MYSTREAAERLGVNVQTIKYHVYKSGRLKPQLVGSQLVFTEADLAEFIAWRDQKAARSDDEKRARHRAQQAAHMRRKRSTNKKTP